MRKILVLFLFSFMGLGTSAQSHLLEFHDLQYHNWGSSVLNLGDKAVFRYASEFIDHGNSFFHLYDKHFIISQNGGVLNSVLVDTIDTHGFGNYMPGVIEKNNSLFFFGSLYGVRERDFRMIIRQTDMELNFLRDTVYDFGNSFINVSDVIIDSNTFLVSGGMWRPDRSLVFILRINDNLEIIDSLLIPLNGSFFYDMTLYLFSDGDLQLLISSGQQFKDILLRIDKQTLSLIDTLHKNGFIGGLRRLNGFVAFTSDSTYSTAVHHVWGNLDTSIYKMCIYNWHQNGELIDSFFLHKDMIIAGMTGLRETILFNNDTLVLIYSHDRNSSILSDSVKVAIVFCDVNGNVFETKYMGEGFDYLPYDILRFDNGNYLVVSRRINHHGGYLSETNGLVVWLLNSKGEIIQSIPLSERPVSTLKAFPNPTTDYLTIQTKDNSSLPNGTLQIFNMQGALQMEQAIPKHQSQVQINLSHLPAGLYLGRIISSNGEGGGFRFVKE